MHVWPELDLTEHEKQYVSYYAERAKGSSPAKPGVLKRVYKRFLSRFAVPEAGINAPQLTQQLQIARRARVFGFVFSGDLGSWYLDMATASGERLTPQSMGATPDPMNNEGCLVSSMVAGTYYNVRANVGEPPNAPGAGGILNKPGTLFGPLLIEPNLILSANTTLVFTGALPPEITDEDEDNRFLGIAIHVWEFPGMAGR